MSERILVKKSSSKALKGTSNFDAKPIRVTSATNERILNRRVYYPSLRRLETGEEVLNDLCDLEEASKALGFYDTLVAWIENRDYLDAIETEKHVFEQNEANEQQRLEDEKKERNE